MVVSPAGHGTVPVGENRHPVARRLPVGAEVQPGGGVHFRVWARDRHSVDVVIEGQAPFPLTPEPEGYFSGSAPQAAAGTLYRYRLDGGDAYPDPVSRFQPEGPHLPSQVVDPGAFPWTDSGWRGAELRGQVVYELHIGTFTPEGTWAAAIEKLPLLADTGVTMLEVMPVSEFPGTFGWGYDGVHLFAPTRLYGQPDDFRRFVDRAHALGLAVILDVVYNHLGPDGNYLGQFARAYFTEHHHTDWGAAINYDDEHCGPVREFCLANAAYWIDEYHLDGLRLDATQDIYDDSEPHILADIGRAARAATRRPVVIIAENEPQETRLVRPLEQGGYGLDALWNDDFHHSAMVRLTGRREAYYTDYTGTAQELVSAVKYGYLYQGQYYQWQQKRRGTPAFGLPPAAFVTFTQNHDQIANSARGHRAHQLCSPGVFKAMTALTLLAPGTPMLFQGQEFAASSPFLYFADHQPELAQLVKAGRRKFLSQFRSLSLECMTSLFSDPHARETFERCRLRWEERDQHAEILSLHRDLLRLRRANAALREQAPRGIDGSVLGADAFLLRFFESTGDDRILIVNLGLDLLLSPAPEPLLGPPGGYHHWEVQWSSEDREYGGCGTPPVDVTNGWMIPGQAAILLRPTRLRQDVTLPETAEEAVHE